MAKLNCKNMQIEKLFMIISPSAGTDSKTNAQQDEWKRTAPARDKCGMERDESDGRDKEISQSGTRFCINEWRAWKDTNN